MRTLLLAALALLGVAAVASAKDCNIVQVAQAWVHALETKDGAKLESFYHRNAIRYDQGVLSPLTKGKPISALQHTCVFKRVDLRFQLRQLSRNWERNAVLMTVRQYTDLELPIEFLVALTFDEDSCLISEERYFHTTEHPAFDIYLDATLEDCWGPDVDISGPMDAVIRVRDCWQSWARGRATEFAACFDANTVWLVNGMPAPAAYLTRDYWANAFSSARVALTGLSVVQIPDTSIVSVFATGTYTLIDNNDANDDSQTYPFAIAQTITMNGNVIANITSVEDTLQWGAWTRALGLDLAPVTVPALEQLTWVNPGPRARIADVVRHFGAPNLFNNQPHAAGLAIWVNERPGQALACLSSVMLRDEAIDAPQLSPNEQVSHTEFLYTSLRVAIPNKKYLQVQNITRSLTYDYLTQTLTSRGDHLGSNLMQLWLALKFAEGSQNFATVQANVGKGIALTLRIDATGSPIYEADSSFAYSELFTDVAQQICNMRRRLNEAAAAK